MLSLHHLSRVSQMERHPGVLGVPCCSLQGQVPTEVWLAVGLHREVLTSYGTWPESLLICSRGTIGHQRTPEPGASLLRPASHASFPQVSFVQWREEVKGMAGRQSDCYLGCFKIDSEIQIPRFHETLPPALAPCWGPECSASFMISFFRNPECCLLGIT